MFFRGFGEGFPYTNFHDLNLDWLIGVVRGLADKYPEFEKTLSEKLNMPKDAGKLGDILTNLANGETQWVSFQEYSVPTIIEAVNDWLNAHPEATTTVQNNSITEAKLYPALRNKINNMDTMPTGLGVYKAVYISKEDLYGTLLDGNWATEGVEYNKNRHRFVFGFIKDNETPALVETDENFVFIRGVSVASGGHMNDITYNPVTDKYYIATMNTLGQVCCVDASTLETESVINPVGISGEISRISYDAGSDSYIIFTAVEGVGNYLYRANSDFSASELLYTDFWGDASANKYEGDIDIIYGQGSTMFNGHNITLFWYGFKNAPAVTRLVFTDIEHKKIEFAFDYQNKHRWDEAEDIVNKDGQLIVFSDLKTTIGITYINASGVTSLDHVDAFKKSLVHYNYTSENTSLLDNLGTATDEDETYKYWVHFAINPEGASGSNSILEGACYNGYAFQTLQDYYGYYYRSMDNNVWNNWYNILQKVRGTDSNILTLALLTNSGGFAYYQYTGTDYTWLPFASSLFRYALFKVQFAFSNRIVEAISPDNRILARNYYVNNAWTGWYIEGIFETNDNVLTLARTISRGRCCIRYKGDDSTWLPDSSYVYGLFEVDVVSPDVVKVTAHAYNGSKFATNFYVNNAWTGWNTYIPST